MVPTIQKRNPSKSDFQNVRNFNGFSFSGKKIAYEPLPENTIKKNTGLKLNFNNLNSSSSGSLSLSGSVQASTKKCKKSIITILLISINLIKIIKQISLALLKYSLKIKKVTVIFHWTILRWMWKIRSLIV